MPQSSSRKGRSALRGAAAHAESTGLTQCSTCVCARSRHCSAFLHLWGSAPSGPSATFGPFGFVSTPCGSSPRRPLSHSTPLRPFLTLPFGPVWSRVGIAGPHFGPVRHPIGQLRPYFFRALISPFCPNFGPFARAPCARANFFRIVLSSTKHVFSVASMTWLRIGNRTFLETRIVPIIEQRHCWKTGASELHD